MNFSLDESIEVLARTPQVLRTLLSDLPDGWIMRNEGGESWSPFDVVGHLIDGERTDWIPRARIMVNRENRAFEPFDRFTHLSANRNRTLAQLIDTFEELRVRNLETLRGFAITEAGLDLPGTHPELGPVTLRQLLATWVVHDLGHIAQITRVMAKQYESEVGVWREYLPVLRR
jgi:DinB superfamily